MSTNPKEVEREKAREKAMWLRYKKAHREGLESIHHSGQFERDGG